MRVTKAQLEVENKRLTAQVGRLLSQRDRARGLVVDLIDLKGQQGVVLTELVRALERRE